MGGIFFPKRKLLHALIFDKSRKILAVKKKKIPTIFVVAHCFHRRPKGCWGARHPENLNNIKENRKLRERTFSMAQDSYCGIRISPLPSQQNATVFWDMLPFCATVAQKVAVRQKRQVATVYAYFYVLQQCCSSATVVLPLFVKKRYPCMLVYMLL